MWLPTFYRSALQRHRAVLRVPPRVVGKCADKLYAWPLLIRDEPEALMSAHPGPRGGVSNDRYRDLTIGSMSEKMRRQ